VRIPVPGITREVGLGRVVAAITQRLGVPACAGCRRRAEALDRRIVFRGFRRDRSEPEE